MQIFVEDGIRTRDFILFYFQCQNIQCFQAWFVEGERVAEVEQRLSKLSQHSEPALVSVYNTLSQEWTEIKKNAGTVRSRAQNIPDLWAQYRAK